MKFGVWQKPVASNPNGACVEVMLANDLEQVPAHKAGAGQLILVRDSKDPDGPRLAFDEREWRAFVTGVKADEFEMPA
jgi:uncharacterized protein DUF397